MRRTEVANARVLSVVVTYHPERSITQALIETLLEQVDAVHVVDNTPGGCDWLAGLGEAHQRSGALRIAQLGENRGIAAAQNVGLRAALVEGFDYVLLSDQDSIPPPAMAETLVQVARDLSEQGVKVGCVCPQYYDETTAQTFRFQVNRPGRLFYSSVDPEPARPVFEIVTTISSGSLLSRDALAEAGLMREEFFIDHVDTEWCHRSRWHGFAVYGTSLVRLNHRLGDGRFNVWFFGWRAQSVYSPVRLYYRFRNFVLLCRLGHVPMRWKIRAGWYWLGNLYAHLIFGPKRKESALMILKGIADGLRRRGGPLDVVRGKVS